ncbi:hypothetical protein DAEQUDRAFT_770674 [Daedalea quercina L-15889]|uniref:Uncharacterized protein n=1 Tax=Daedalea quercina L-15889 TaxID=1314783 RepID=A0A165KNN3_9APHY|nr:hypothetical protein DAEQUDRAFT_770674 [Daedalea quercina L-15889]
MIRVAPARASYTFPQGPANLRILADITNGLLAALHEPWHNADLYDRPPCVVCLYRNFLLTIHWGHDQGSHDVPSQGSETRSGHSPDPSGKIPFPNRAILVGLAFPSIPQANSVPSPKLERRPPGTYGFRRAIRAAARAEWSELFGRPSRWSLPMATAAPRPPVLQRAVGYIMGPLQTCPREDTDKAPLWNPPEPHHWPGTFSRNYLGHFQGSVRALVLVGTETSGRRGARKTTTPLATLLGS